MVNAVHTFLNGISESEFQKKFHKEWIKQINCCIQAEGRYFEKESHPDADSDYLNKTLFVLVFCFGFFVFPKMTGASYKKGR